LRAAPRRANQVASWRSLIIKAIVGFAKEGGVIPGRCGSIELRRAIAHQRISMFRVRSCRTAPERRMRIVS
jgi:hypothetical protein